MNKKIKIAVVHSNDAILYNEANPYHRDYDSEAPRRCVDNNINKMLSFLNEAGSKKADLVCMHEDIKGSGMYLRYLDYPDLFLSLAEEIPGPTSCKIGEIARKYNMYVAANYYEKDGNDIYNTSVLIGRDGEIVGKYRKVHPADCERWRVTGGKDFPVFETDIGKIGFAICYDMIFPETCRAVAVNGADIIIHQTQGWGIVCFALGEALVRTRAAENSVYLVVAKNIQKGDGGRSCIIDNYGNIMAETQEDEEQLLLAEFEPNFDLEDEGHFDNFFAGITGTRARVGLARKPSLYRVLTNENPPLNERYRELKLISTSEEAKNVFEQWKEYRDAINNNKPVKTRYHW